LGETNGTYYHPDQQVIQNLDNFHANGNEEVGDESEALSAENENYLPASELLKTDDPAEWDILLGHGGVSTSNTKWERESLYQNFDPLAQKKAEFAVPIPPQNPRIELVKEATCELTPGVLISLTPPQGTPNGRHARESMTLDEPEHDEPCEAVIKSELPEDISPPDSGRLSIHNQDDAELGSQTPNYSDGTYSVHSSDVETDHSECHNPEEDVSQPEVTFVKPTSSIRAPKAIRSQRPSETLNVTYDGREFASDLQEVNDVAANETFVSTDSFQSALTNVEWDLLVDRGTGSCSAATKWERESLAQKFDPLVSLREQQEQERRANVAAAVHELGDSLEESSCDGPSTPHPHALKQDSKLISIDTPPHSKIRGNMTIRSEDMGDHEDSETNEFSESHLEHSGDEAFPDEVLSSDDLEIKKLKQHLEIQARNFQEQMTQRSLKLKEIEEAITSASRKLDAQQQSNRVLKEYEKSIAALEGEIDRIKRQITKTDAERKKIAEERDYAADDLRQAEVAFSDLHK